MAAGHCLSINPFRVSRYEINLKLVHHMLARPAVQQHGICQGNRERLHAYLEACCNMCCPSSEGICISTLSLLTPFKSPKVLNAVPWELLGLCPNG